MRSEKYLKLRNVVENSIAEMVRRDLFPDEEYLNLLSVYPLFEENKEYVVKDLIRYDNELYEVIQTHTSQNDWDPSILPALYKKVVPESVIPEWVQPIGAHDAYHKGDKVVFHGKVYESTIDNNTWSPSEYGWVLA